HADLGEALANQGHLAAAAASFREALRLQPDLAATHSSLLITLNLDPHATPADLLAEHQRWAEVHAPGEILGPEPRHDRRPHRRVRVGYMSATFHKHVISLFLEPFLAQHDPGQVEVFGYADVPAPDQVTARLRSLAHQWRSLCGLPDAEVARLVRSDQIDILV